MELLGMMPRKVGLFFLFGCMIKNKNIQPFSCLNNKKKNKNGSLRQYVIPRTMIILSVPFDKN